MTALSKEAPRIRFLRLQTPITPPAQSDILANASHPQLRLFFPSPPPSPPSKHRPHQRRVSLLTHRQSGTKTRGCCRRPVCVLSIIPYGKGEIRSNLQHHDTPAPLSLCCRVSCATVPRESCFRSLPVRASRDTHGCTEASEISASLTSARFGGSGVVGLWEPVRRWWMLATASSLECNPRRICAFPPSPVEIQ